MTRCKFKCEKVTHHEYGSDAEFSVVQGDSPENKEFFEASPNGNLKLTRINKKIVFCENAEYYLDITPVHTGKTDEAPVNPGQTEDSMPEQVSQEGQASA